MESHHHNNSNEKFKEFPGMAPYTKQVIVCFAENDAKVSIDVLKKKWDDQHPDSPCEIIHFKDLNSKKLNYKKEDIIRIYVIGHHNPEEKKHATDLLNCGERPKFFIDCEELSARLAKFTNENEMQSNSVINLIACCAATSESSQHKFYHSFAGQLQRKMKNHGANVPVVARASVVKIVEDGKKTTRNMGRIIVPHYENEEHYIAKNRHQHHQPGSKVIFFTDATNSNHQVITDAYEKLWKKRVIKALAISIKDEVDEKKNFLLLLKKQFESKHSAEIAEILSRELKDDDSPLNKNPYFFTIFNATATRIKDLVEEWESIVNSNKTTKTMIYLNKSKSSDH